MKAIDNFMIEWGKNEKHLQSLFFKQHKVIEWIIKDLEDNSGLDYSDIDYIKDASGYNDLKYKQALK